MSQWTQISHLTRVADTPNEDFLQSVLQADPDKLRAHLTGGQSPDQMFNFNGSCLSPLHLACITGNYQAAQLLTRSSKQPEVNVNRQSSHGESPLFVASAYGHDRLVSSLILQGANVDLPQKLGCTPLWVAAQNGHRAVVQLLIEAQANVNQSRTDVRSTPLYMAAQNGHWEIVTQLVSAMADVDAQKTDGCSPMYIAAQNGHRQVVAALLKAQTTLDLQQERGRTAIYAAAQEGHAEVVEVLSRAAADVNIQQVDGATSLLIATQFGHRQIVRCLLELGVPDVNLAEFSGATPMYIASQEGHVEIVQALVQAMADIDQAMLNGSTPLYAAVQNGRKLVVQELIKAKAAVEPETAHLCTPLYGASFLGDRSIVDSLLKLGANPNLDCGISVIQPALHVAVHCNQLPIVLSLIKAQVEVNQIGELGTTALYTAAQENHWKIARALVEANADADATLHPEGAAPIHIASQLGHHRIVQLLAKVALADVNLRLSSGRTALHLASQAGHAASVKILLSVPQIDMNLTDSTGCSALLAASREGHTNTVDLLLAAGAVPELKAHDGITPMLISALNGHRKVLDRLTSYRSTMKLSVDNYFPASTASEQSLLVHQSMLRAGFTRSRAALQTAAAEVLHQLVPARSRCDKENKIFVMGSFAEGWGSCMASLNGDIDPDSDIDYLMIDTNQLFHLKNYCRCRHPDPASVRKTVEYCNGEITCDDFASNCSTKHVETGNKSLGPAIHLETALSLCCYPPMAVLQPQNDSNMSQRVLDLLRQEITSTPCHLVRAASPGSAGSQFRVSTAFLERKLMQNLTTLQGQLFVIIKYLFKRVISNCVPGLKTYHAKTLLFRMLEATPADQWRPENLFSLTRHALQMMLNYVEQSCNLKTFDGQIMRHFFLSDAALYLQGQSRDTAMKIAQCLIELIHQLPYILAEFNDGLASIPDSENFSFHPFLLLLTLEEKPKPLIEASIEKFALEIQYLSIYDNVKEALVMLDEDDTSSDCRSVLDDVIARLPDCASKSRETLRALSCIKFGRLEAASEVLLSSRQPEVHRGISWKEELSQFEPTKELVWQHLRSHDSAWKFYLKFDSPIKLNFLSVNNIFSTCLLISGNEIYVNFEALHRSLSVALCRS